MALGIPALNQAAGRRHQVAFDQHGRKWSFWVDKKTGFSCTTPSPQFRAPWYPPSDIIRIDPETPGAVKIDYDPLLLQRREAHAAFRRLMIQAANHFNVPNWNPDRDAPTAQMKNDIGNPPLPIEPVLAAKAGNKFVLGLRPYQPEKYPADVKLAEALAIESAPPRGIDAIPADAIAQFADDVADEAEALETPRGRKRSRQPVG